VISRPLVILLAFIAAAMRGSQGAWPETIGLAALGTGLLILRVAETKPALKPYAWLCFLLTGAAVVMVFMRNYA